jgi:hypothetical protein
MAPMLRFEVATADGRASQLEIEHPFCVLCGFSGRDADEVAAHARELDEIGVATPAVVPFFMVMPEHVLVAAGSSVDVVSADTSGEAEPVLIRTAEGEQFVSVGSDHTDRAIEPTSILASKLACPKVLSNSAWRMDDVAERWDDLQLTGAVPGAQPHQRGTLAALRRPADLVAGMEQAVRVSEGRPLVMFLGTVVGSAAIPAGSDSFTARLHDAAAGRTLECAYAVEDVSAAHRTKATA